MWGRAFAIAWQRRGGWWALQARSRDQLLYSLGERAIPYAALYAKTFAGWVQALTTGLPGYPPTIAFFRNTVISDTLFTAIFIACMAWQPRMSAPERVALASR